MSRTTPKAEQRVSIAAFYAGKAVYEYSVAGRVFSDASIDAKKHPWDEPSLDRMAAFLAAPDAATEKSMALLRIAGSLLAGEQACLLGPGNVRSPAAVYDALLKLSTMNSATAGSIGFAELLTDAAANARAVVTKHLYVIRFVANLILADKGDLSAHVLTRAIRALSDEDRIIKYLPSVRGRPTGYVQVGNEFIRVKVLAAMHRMSPVTLASRLLRGVPLEEAVKTQRSQAAKSDPNRWPPIREGACRQLDRIYERKVAGGYWGSKPLFFIELYTPKLERMARDLALMNNTIGGYEELKAGHDRLKVALEAARKLIVTNRESTTAS